MAADKRGSERTTSQAGDLEFRHVELTEKIIGVFYAVYNELGHGFLEYVYERAMVIALQQAQLRVDSQHPIQVVFRGQVIGQFFADLVVAECVIVEIKAARALEAAHESQLLNYLRATRYEVGLLMNFGPKPEVRRLAFDNQRKAANNY